MTFDNSDILPEQIVSFLLEGREYGVSLEVVQEIIPMIEIVSMPELPDHALGIINLRGASVPIIDLKKKMGLAATEVSLYTPIIICRLSDVLVGIMVDKLSEIITLDDPNRDRVTGSEERHSMIDSVISIGDRTIFYIKLENLDLESIFTHSSGKQQ